MGSRDKKIGIDKKGFDEESVWGNTPLEIHQDANSETCYKIKEMLTNNNNINDKKATWIKHENQ